MKLARDPRLDALCGEYLLGTLRGAARRRFERALHEEPLVAARLRHWVLLVPRHSAMIETPPPPSGWPRLERELQLSRFRTPWHRRLSLWRGWAIAATAAALLVLGVQLLPPERAPAFTEIAQLSGPGDAARVSAALSADRTTLELRASRPVLAGPAQSYELWLIPPEGAPVSLAVLGSLDARLTLPAAQVARLTRGAKLAVSVEPAGGSPTGAPTGPVLFAGAIGA